MSTHHTGGGAFWTMLRECHRHIFGEEGQATLSVVQPLPAAFDSEKRLDYDVRTDDSPVYVAFCELPYNDTASDTWIIQKFTYDGSNRVTRIQVARGAWDDRASLFA